MRDLNSKFLVLISLLLLLVLATVSVSFNAQIPAPYSRWVKYVDLSKADDIAYGSCIYGRYVAVVGTANFTLFWSRAAVALLDRDTGSVVKTWVSEPSYPIEISSFGDCISVDDKLYVAGGLIATTFVESISKGFIYVFDYNLNPLKIVEVDGASLTTITYANGYFYAAGEKYMDIDGDGKNESVIYIEKRSSDLTLIASNTIYRSNWNTTHVYGIAIDDATGNVWVAGYFVDDSKNIYTVIVLLDSNLRPIKLLIYSITDPYYIEKTNTLCLNEDGYAYVFGSGVLKFDRSGNIIAINRGINATILAFSSALIELVMYVLDENLNLLSTVIIERNTSE